MSAPPLFLCAPRGAAALEALQDISRRLTANPTFATAADKLRAATAEVQSAAAELRGVGHHVVDSARQREEAVVQRALAALDSSRAVTC